MHLHCPHCRNPIEVLDAAANEEIQCPSCGSSFCLDMASTVDWDARYGQKLGNFQIIDMVGQGAFGTVYKARDLKLDRLVAVKVPRAGNLVGPQDRERFLREARSAAQLRHPSIVTVHEVGQIDELSYLVSDFVEGITLSDWLSAGGPSFLEAAALIVQLADALQYAHDQGVVHRDIKPSNIMLELTSAMSAVPKEAKPPEEARHALAHYRPRIMDFGLAKREAGEITMTIDGQILGTPAYMSPEQAKGEAYRVDGRSDVYSLGVILYQLLCGDLPFRGTKRMLLHQVLQDEPRSPRRLNEKIPRDLETICLKAMAKEPGRRFQRAQDLADDLRRFLHSEPILARPVGKLEAAMKWVRRNPVVSVLLAAILLLSIGGSTGIYVKYQDAKEQESIAKKNEQTASLQEKEAKKQEAEAFKQAGIAKENENKAIRAVGEKDNALKDLEYNLALDQILLAQRAFDSGNVTLAHERLDKVPAELRRWEWHYLKRQYDGGIFTLYGHTASVNSVAVSPDGTRLVTGSDDGSAKVWDARTGTLLLEFKGHISGVSSVAISPDGTRLVAGSGDGVVKVWDARTGKHLLELKGHTHSVYSVAFSPDGTRLATGSLDGTMSVWDAPSGTHLLELNLLGPVYSVAFSPDGTRLVTGCGGTDGTARVWNARSGTHLLELKGHNGSARSVAFSPDGTRLVTGSFDNTATVWDARAGTVLLELTGHTGEVSGVAFSPDGTRLVTGSRDQTARVWDARTGAQLLELKGHTGSVRSVVFSPDGTLLVTGSFDNTAKVWDARSGTVLLELTGHIDGVSSVAFSPDGTRLVTGSFDNTAKVRDAGTGTVLLEIEAGRHSDEVSSAAFNPDGTSLVTGSANGTAKFWDVRTGKQLLELKELTQGVFSVAFSPDGKHVVVAGMIAGGIDGTANVCDARTGRHLLELKGHTAPVSSVMFSPEGTRLVTGSFDGTAKVWDARTGKRLLELKAHPEGVLSVAFSPDGTRLVTGSEDRTARVWDARAGRLLLELKGHLSTVTRVEFSPDGTRIVTASTDRTAKIWDARIGTPLLDLKGHTGPLFSVAFSPDGTRLVTGSFDKTARIWDGRVRTKNGVLSPEERAYRVFWTRPRPDLHREEYTKAIQANDTFAARFHLDRLLAYLPQERAALLVTRNKLQKSDLLLQARTAVHSPKLAKVAIEPIVFLAMQWDPKALRLLGGLALRAGNPSSAIGPLSLALALRAKDRPPVEELLLALAYLDAKDPGEAARWHAKATQWLDRYRQPMQVMSSLGSLPNGALAGITELFKPPADPRYNAFDWESWYECEVFRPEVEAKIRKK